MVIGSGRNTSIWSDPWIPRIVNFTPAKAFTSDSQRLKKASDLCFGWRRLGIFIQLSPLSSSIFPDCLASLSSFPALAFEFSVVGLTRLVADRVEKLPVLCETARVNDAFSIRRLRKTGKLDLRASRIEQRATIGKSAGPRVNLILVSIIIEGQGTKKRKTINSFFKPKEHTSTSGDRLLMMMLSPLLI
ncbi:tRNA 5-methylaminomethyl-2-thiouridinebiosynthesis bifunctional protein MnmC [Striga asiatica]|uniref:tRNA 5-methylaminomethyl-2-thiouridinebiosynthesis bifunctional protein MnmC n=1 Tax=Striga asiatica TaxID=4170 RepID=A0A5A7PGC6_STRAF|nr:tRNA 5-methylaminomethyl-2-thiouridinebiosynthesis bifunctional protein MnmC [Striga asiatica]